MTDDRVPPPPLPSSPPWSTLPPLPPAGGPVPPRLVAGAYWLEGKRLPRVSEVLAVLANPGLARWRERVGAAEADRRARAAATRGSLVHRLCERVAREGPAAVAATLAREPDLADMVRAYGAWLAREVAAVLAVEAVVWHPRLRYAGTLDLLARLRDGRVVVVDIKTGRTGGEAAARHRLQLAAYAEAVEALGWARVDGRLVVALPVDVPGQVRVVACPAGSEAVDRRAWRWCVGLWWWLQAREREAIARVEVDG